ncbi:hypothetical protein D3C78_1170150 [compost metagenome]
MQLVHHHEAQQPRRVVAPQPLILRPQQQVVEHLVVGEQDVRRVLAQGVAMGDHLIGRHAAVLRTVIAGEQADAELGLQLAHFPGEAPRLIGGQGVHRIDDDRLDALATLAQAVVEQRIHEALGLARAGAGGDDGRLRQRAAQSLEGQLLMPVRRERQAQLTERQRLALGLRAERQLHFQPRPLVQVAGHGEEAVDEAVPLRIKKTRRGHREGTAQKVFKPVLDLTGD